MTIPLEFYSVWIFKIYSTKSIMEAPPPPRTAPCCGGGGLTGCKAKLRRSNTFMLVSNLLLQTGWFYFNLMAAIPSFFDFISSVLSLSLGKLLWFLLSFVWPLWPHSWQKEWFLGSLVSTKMEIPVGITLAERPRTFCPRVNTFTL